MEGSSLQCGCEKFPKMLSGFYRTPPPQKKNKINKERKKKDLQGWVQSLRVNPKVVSIAVTGFTCQTVTTPAIPENWGFQKMEIQFFSAENNSMWTSFGKKLVTL